MEGNGDTSRFKISSMATNTLYDCANCQGLGLYSYLPCDIPWNSNMISEKYYERNGDIKRDVPLEDRPPLNFFEPAEPQKYNLYNRNQVRFRLSNVYPANCKK